MIGRPLYSAGLRGRYLHATALGFVGLSLGLWVRAKAVDQDERGNKERRAMFVGVWPPMIWLIGDAVDRGAPRRGRLRS